MKPSRKLVTLSTFLFAALMLLVVGVASADPGPASAPETCGTCHPVSGLALATGAHGQHFNDPDGPRVVSCAACHLPPGPRHDDGTVEFRDGEPLGSTTACDGCHGQNSDQAKQRWAKGGPLPCQGCHPAGSFRPGADTAGAHWGLGVSVPAPPVEAGLHGQEAAPVSAKLSDVCYPQKLYLPIVMRNSGPPGSSQRPSDTAGYPSATSEPHLPLLMKTHLAGTSLTVGRPSPASSNYCLNCHQQQVGGRRPIAPEFTARSHHALDAVAQDDCQVCHDQTTHLDGYVDLFDVDTGTTPYRFARGRLVDLTPFCQGCHDGDGSLARFASGGCALDPFADGQSPPTVLSTHSNEGYPSHTEPSFTKGCNNCHDAHGSSNIYLVWEKIGQNTVVFTNTSGTGPDSYDEDSDDPSNSDDVCATCHTQTEHNNVSNVGVHVLGMRCTDCHPHDPDDRAGSHRDAFMPAGGGCVGCHSMRQDNGDGVPPGGRRGVTGEFALRSHHALSGTNGAETTDADCAVCHDQSTHMDGYVDLYDADGGGVYRFITPMTTSLSNPTPFDLIPFCLSCHDDDGSMEHADGSSSYVGDPTDPFSDSVTVPDVASYYATAGHGLTSTAHYARLEVQGGTGNGNPGANVQCFGCHEMGHGAEADSMLQHDNDTSNTLCNQCHPTGNSVTGFYVGTAGFEASAHGNDAQGNLLCTSCHNPHGTANTAMLFTSVPVPGMEEAFCYTCHDDPANAANGLDVQERFAGTLGWYESYGGQSFPVEGTGRYVNSHHDVSTFDQALSGARIECFNCHNVHVSRSPAVRGLTSPSAYNTAFYNDTATLIDPYDNRSLWGGTLVEFCLVCHSGQPGAASPAFPPTVDGPDQPLRGLDSCDYQLTITDVDGGLRNLYNVEFTWANSVHGAMSKRGWPGYTGAPAFDMPCTACHDPHGSYSAGNPTGNPYLIRDYVQGSFYLDDGGRQETRATLDPPVPGVDGSVVITWAEVALSDGGVPFTTTHVGWWNLCDKCHSRWTEVAPAHNEYYVSPDCQVCHNHGSIYENADYNAWDWHSDLITVNDALNYRCPPKQ